MSGTYRRLSRHEIDSELRTRKSKDERIDFLRWLLLQDEEALTLSPEENHLYAYVTFDSEGYRRVAHSGGVTDSNERKEINKKTEHYREYIKSRLKYFEDSRGDIGPYAFEDEKHEDQAPDTSSSYQVPDRIQWRGNVTDLVYLFMRLEQKGFLGKDFGAQPWAHLKKHFTDRQNKELYNLKQVKQNIENSKTGKSAKGDTIDSIFSEINDLTEEEKRSKL